MYIFELGNKLLSKTSLEVLTAFATTGATFFAWRTTVTNKQQAKEQIEEQHRVERPRLVPLNKDVFINTLGSHPLSPWNRNDPPMEEDSYRNDELDNFYFTLINTGKSFALKIELRFELIGGIDSIHEFETPNFSLTIDNHDFLPFNPSSFKFTTQYHAYGGTNTGIFTVDSFQRRFPLLKSNESVLIRIPEYFVKLNNFYLFNFITSKPRMRLTINYIDQYHEKHNDIYIMELKQNPLSLEEHEDKENIVDKNELYLDFKNITPKKTKGADSKVRTSLN